MLSMVDVIGHDDWCHGSRCASCPPCTWGMNDCTVWNVAERVADAVILFYSRLNENINPEVYRVEDGHTYVVSPWPSMEGKCHLCSHPETIHISSGQIQ